MGSAENMRGEGALPSSSMVPLGGDPSQALDRSGGLSGANSSPIAEFCSPFSDEHRRGEEPAAQSHSKAMSATGCSPMESSSTPTIASESFPASSEAPFVPSESMLVAPVRGESLLRGSSTQEWRGSRLESSSVLPHQSESSSSGLASESSVSIAVPKLESLSMAVLLTSESSSLALVPTLESSSGTASESLSAVVAMPASESSSLALVPTLESSSVSASESLSAVVAMPASESSSAWAESMSESSSKAAAPTPEYSSMVTVPSPEASQVVAVATTESSLAASSKESTFESSFPGSSSFTAQMATAIGRKGSAMLESGRRSSIARFKTMMPARLPIPRSPYLTIPPGISPTTLLDSPVLLPTNQAEPSPTTGTFPLPHISQSMRLETADNIRKNSNEDVASIPFSFDAVSAFIKNPHSPLPKLPEPQMTTPLVVQPVVPVHGLVSQAIDQSTGPALSFWDVSDAPSSPQAIRRTVPKTTSPPQAIQRTVPETTSPPQAIRISENMNVKNKPSTASEPVFVQPLPYANLHAVERPSGDGYNWRKYGQKQVKGSEFPRSYYKCTHLNCQVKKKVEHAHDGHVMEIIYKGEHDHPKPQSTRRSSMGANGSGREGLLSSVSRSSRGDCHEQQHNNKSEASFAASRGQNGTTAEPSLGSVSDVESDGEAIKVGNGDDRDDDDDEPDSKRRRESFEEVLPSSFPLRTAREPRVVVQTISKVDILDDGYRWRKYGQKIVKGNLHPRSYYKCTNIGCLVRKHVERSSTDWGAVITTYEGKHNHDVPIVKNRHRDHST